LGDFKFKTRYLKRIKAEQLFNISIMPSSSLHILFIANMIEKYSKLILHTLFIWFSFLSKLKLKKIKQQIKFITTIKRKEIN